MPKIVIVDDKLPMAETLADGLSDRGFEARAVGSAREALALLPETDVLVTDLRMPEVDGLSLLDRARVTAPDVPVIVMTAYGAIDSAVESIRKGAFHYLTKPFKLDELLVFVERALSDRDLRRETQALRKSVRERYSLAGLVGKSPQMQQVLQVVRRIAATKVPVLLTGETGTGKGAVARAIHGESVRAHGPYIAVNCAALPDQLLESELFGHTKGSFTGAVADRDGLFADASGGTLLLDEIGEMSPALQAKLLHVLEAGTVRPVGATKERSVDVRVIAATHRDLRAKIKEGTFREDLMYRLDVVSIELPPLRHRREDIPLLVEHFLAESRARHPHSPVTGFARDALAVMLDHAWPGNVRELAHLIERCVLLGNGHEVTAAELPAQLREPPPTAQQSFEGAVMPIRELQRRYARWALDRLGGHKARTAAELGVDTKTLNRWLAGDDEI